MELHRQGQRVPLEPLIYRVLLHLLERRDRVVTKDELLEDLWAGKVVSDATLSNALKLARKAVGDTGDAQQVIRTVRGHGYRFVASVQQLDPGPLAARPRTTDQERPALPVMPSLALLGFEDLGGHPASGVFSEGLAVDLNARLARLHGLFVIARHSARRFSVQEMSMPEIGSLLGVRYLIHGSTQRLDRRIRVTVNLAEAETGQVIWTEHFDRIVDDLFAVQDDIVHSVIAALLPELERAEMDRARLLPTENLDAWECYHRAMWHNFRFTAGDSQLARSLLLKAGELDPQFSRARAGMSFNHFLHAFLHTDRAPEEHIRRALDYAQQSVNLDVRDAMSHWVLGRALFLSGEHDQALRSLDRALQANPNYAQGRYARGFVMVHNGLAEQALADLDGARRLSPFDPMLFAMKSCRAISLAVQGDREGACAWAVEATEEPNAHFHIHAVAAACLQMAGRTDEARQAIRRVLALHPGYSIAHYDRSFPHGNPEHRQIMRDALRAAGLAAS
ncbi:MAG: winged helix-turn-helix domain-containing protein [Pseudomonadales bacterium]